MDQQQPQYELAIQVGLGCMGSSLLHWTDLPDEGARKLSIDLIQLIQLTYQLTNAYPIAGDHLNVAHSDAGVYGGATYCERLFREGEMADWLITKRTYSGSLGGLLIIFELQLARLQFLGPPDEALDLEALLRVLPTPQAQRTVHRWATNPQQPVRTWQQLAQRCGELSSERGFNVQHFAVIERALLKHGYSLVRG